MIYSVWNQARGEYDYFQTANGQDKLNVEKPSHLQNRTLGSTVQQAAWPLPADAVRTGAGPNAIGRVASRKSAALGDDAGSMSLVKLGLLALSGVLLWKYVVKPPRRARRRWS